MMEGGPGKGCWEAAGGRGERSRREDGEGGRRKGRGAAPRAGGVGAGGGGGRGEGLQGLVRDFALHPKSSGKLSEHFHWEKDTDPIWGLKISLWLQCGEQTQSKTIQNGKK